MILIRRGTEPKTLVDAGARELPRLRGIALSAPPASEDITGYRVAGAYLWKSQHYKCCYCEYKIKELYNDVEHYRPKARANRQPGCIADHGYWWLAFNWENLLFACPSCNRSKKNDRFPLMVGDTPLQAEESPPGKERPYVLDPGALINPVEHIRFEYRRALVSEPTCLRGPMQWFARPRNRSLRGNFTIDVCGLNDADLVELRRDHVDQWVQPHVEELSEAISSADPVRVQRAYFRALGMLNPRSAYVALTYDALRHFIPNAKLRRWRWSWPEPKNVGLPTSRPPT